VQVQTSIEKSQEKKSFSQIEDIFDPLHLVDLYNAVALHKESVLSGLTARCEARFCRMGNQRLCRPDVRRGSAEWAIRGYAAPM